jgi:hypothetical protein
MALGGELAGWYVNRVWFRVPVHSSTVQIQGSPFSSQENLDPPVRRTANPEF